MDDKDKALLHDIKIVLAHAVLPQNPGSVAIWNVTSDRLQAAQRVARALAERIEDEEKARLESAEVKKEKKAKKKKEEPNFTEAAVESLLMETT